MRTLVLFTRDLRLRDHPALFEACRVSDEVVPLFVLDPRLLRVSPNRTRVLAEGLIDLDRALVQRGARLIVRHGDPARVAVGVAAETDCDQVFVTGDVTAVARARDARLAAGLASIGVGVRTFPGHAVVEAGEVAPAGREAYRVFTPYHRAWLAAPRRSVLPAPERIDVPGDVRSEPMLEPRSVVPDALDLPLGGERHAQAQLGIFLRTSAPRYGELRNDLAADATSRLSPYLRLGFISANEVASQVSSVDGAEGFVRQLAWRDFFAQLLAADPGLARHDLRAGPAVPPVSPPDVPPDEALKLWAEGRTGLPLVDAGMRQLRREGWIHNRSRMVVASFLTRRVGVPWQEGARVFGRYLVDGDPASNAGGWQWVAGTGTDPRRSRVFNPVRQAQRYDPAGDYVRRYVRELRNVPTPAIFAPWKDHSLLESSRYPEPVVSVPG